MCCDSHEERGFWAFPWIFDHINQAEVDVNRGFCGFQHINILLRVTLKLRSHHNTVYVCRFICMKVTGKDEEQTR